jgi:hypothetical protein
MSPSSHPPSRGARTPPDLAPEETAYAEILGRLGRAVPPEGLEARLHQAWGAGRRSRLGPSWVPALAAAALLAALGIGLGARSAPRGGDEGLLGRCLVVDDPRVSPYPGLDSFEGLAHLAGASEPGR